MLVVFVIQLGASSRPGIAPFVFFYVAVAFASLLGGRVPGLVAVGLSAALANYAFITPSWSWATTGPALRATALYVVGSTVVALLCAAFRESLLRAQQTAEELHRREAALRESEQRLRAIFENVALGIGEIDADGRLAVVNERLCRILGYSPDELLGRSVVALTAPEDRERTREMNARLWEGRLDGFEYDKRYLRRDGAPLWVHVTVSAVRDQGGKLLRSIGTVEDISERRHASEQVRRLNEALERRNAELDAERMRWRGVVEGIADELWVCDAEGRMTLINLVETTPMGLKEFEGRILAEVFAELEITYLDGRPRPTEETPLFRSLRGEVVRGEEIMRHRKTGTVRYRQFSSAPMRDAAGAITGAVAIVRDVTRNKRMEQALRNANAQLVEVNLRKNEFLAMLSHELRNPLAPIRNSLYVLERAAPGGQQAKRAHEVIGRQVTHMTRLIDDLLDVTRISRGKIRLQRERVELCDLVRRTAEDHSSLFSSVGVELEVAICEGPLVVVGDSVRLSQVVGNFLSNAAKFTPRGGHVRLRLHSESGRASIHVHDDGAGIAPDLLPKLFEPFVQADATLDRSKGGLGLGLALVKGLVELHGGTVSARSAGPGRGAEFIVQLPLVQTETPGQELGLAPPRSGTKKPLRVLVIEDNADAADTLKQVLELGGHEVETVGTGQEGIEKAHASRPDVVLCDIGLPGLDGYEVARALREDAQLHGMALVALTGYALAEDQKRAFDAGFDRHLAKPPDLGVLEQILGELSEPHAA